MDDSKKALRDAVTYLETQLIAEIHCAFDGFGSAMAATGGAP